MIKVLKNKLKKIGKAFKFIFLDYEINCGKHNTKKNKVDNKIEHDGNLDMDD